ncbi:MAG: PEP-CTERM sorting domain-containing protein [Alphaproteobacteria bacterium]|nr:PEP-CTERM sorting domain-containing protein [Alphaproteobacteria bacterium]
MPPATHRITLLSATSLASVVAVAGVQPADAAVVYTVQVRDPSEITQSTTAVTTPLSVTEVLGVASGGGPLLTTTNPAYTLVGTTASRSVTFSRRATSNSGSNAQSGATTLTVTTPTTASSASFSAVFNGGSPVFIAVNPSTNRTRTLIASVTPTERSNSATISGSFTVTGTNPNANSGSGWSYAANTADNTNFTFQTIAVAPVNSTTPTNTTVYALPGKTGSGTFNIQNVGDGSYVGASLTGTLTTTVTGGFAGSVANGNFALADGKAPSTPAATTLTQTLTFTGGASRTVTGTATLTAAFTNGSTLGTNASQTVTQTFQGVTVAPVATTSASSPGSTQYVLVGSGGTATGSFTVKNTGDGTLAGANLTGTVTNTLGTGFTASAPAGAISLGDSNLAGPNGTSLTQTVTYKDEGTRSGTVRVASSVATFTNGSADGKNNAAASVSAGFSAQSVAPVASVTATLNAGTVRVGTSSAVALTVQNTGDGNLAGKDNGTSLLTNLRGTVGAGKGSFSGGGGAVNLTDTTGGQSAANASSTYMFTYAPAARTSGLTESVSVSTTLQNGASNANAAGSSTTTLSGIAVGPDFDAAVAGKNASSGPIINGGTIMFGESVGGLTLQDLLISNLSNDAASKALTDLTLTNVTITGSTEFSFSLSGFDSGNTVGFGSSSKNAVLSNLANGDGSGAIAIQFVSKAGNGAAQLRIETDEGAALGGAGAIYVYNLIWSVPEPGTIAIFGAGLLGLAISRQRRRGRAFVALTAKPEEDKPASAG